MFVFEQTSRSSVIKRSMMVRLSLIADRSMTERSIVFYYQPFENRTFGCVRLTNFFEFDYVRFPNTIERLVFEFIRLPNIR